MLSCIRPCFMSKWYTTLIWSPRMPYSIRARSEWFHDTIKMKISFQTRKCDSISHFAGLSVHPFVCSSSPSMLTKFGSITRVAWPLSNCINTCAQIPLPSAHPLISWIGLWITQDWWWERFLNAYNLDCNLDLLDRMWCGVAWHGEIKASLFQLSWRSLEWRD